MKIEGASGQQILSGRAGNDLPKFKFSVEFPIQ